MKIRFTAWMEKAILRKHRKLAIDEGVTFSAYIERKLEGRA